MSLVNVALVFALTACSGAAGSADKPAQREPSPGLGPTLPETAQRVADPQPTAAESQPTAAAPEPAAPAAGVCKFGTLQRFEGRTVKWEGECLEGKAHGKGALRAYPKAGSSDKAVLIFFGTLERGDAKLGVIETPDGFMAGEFAQGTLQESEDPNVTLRAFKVAVEAANLVSERLKAAGNAASATFYAKKAQNLQQQMH